MGGYKHKAHLRVLSDTIMNDKYLKDFWVFKIYVAPWIGSAQGRSNKLPEIHRSFHCIIILKLLNLKYVL
jgi:hypothetical protein